MIFHVRFYSSLALLTCVALARLPIANAEDAATKITDEQVQFFESKIRPILVDHCYQCHSADAGDDLEGGLFLDSRWGWSTGGDSGPAIIPGDVDNSLVMQAVLYHDDAVSAMPPSSKLADDEIQSLEKWIRDGAADPREKVGDDAAVEKFNFQERFDQHWSWRKIVQPKTPEVHDKTWANNFIDSFILSKLESAGIKPASAADKEIWLRRVYFDLTGLPPTLEQIDAFLSDNSQNARQKVVDGLLDSPQFGEKWARHWMDLVRYAETYGHEFDYPIPSASEYRNYLIRAFNADVPYDQLIREHLAGDLIANPRRNPEHQFNESIIGTGFWYLHEATHAPTDVLKNESDIIDNQLDVFGKTFLGLTVACARCHDHKFDAISTADYYALSGYLQSSCRQLYPLDVDGKTSNAVRQLKKLQRRYVAATRSDNQFLGDVGGPAAYVDAAVKLLGESPKAKAPSTESLESLAADRRLQPKALARWVDGLQKAKPDFLSDDPFDVLAYRIKNPDSQEQAAQQLKERTEQRTEYKGTQFVDFGSPDFGGDQLPAGWSTTGRAFQLVSESSRFVPLPGVMRPEPGTVDSGVFGKAVVGTLRSPTFQISTRNIHVRMRANAETKVRLIVDNYQMATYNALLFRGMSVEKKSSDTKGEWVWKSLGNDLRKYVGHNAYLEIVDNGASSIAVDEIWFSDNGPPPTKPAFAASVLEYWDDPDAGWQAVNDVYQKAIPNRVVNWLLDKQLVDRSAASHLVKRIEAKAGSIARSVPKPRFVLAMAQGTNENAHVYVRGNSSMLGQQLPARNLQALGGHTVGRLELANEIARLENPLTARVLVNRLWHHLFGRGIVPSTDDFGPQGQAASHPELLDALAVDLVKNGWSIKHSIRNIVLSKTYAQSSTTNPVNDASLVANVDPTNALLYRMPIRRLPAESIRDQILAVSGTLNRQPFDGSVPTYRTPFMTGRGARASGPMDGDGRRSVYLAVYRNFLNPFMTTFDAPNPFGPRGRRSKSNVPAQSLTLLNDPFVIDQAKRWSDSLAKEDLTDEQRIKQMVRTAHGVTPSDKQVQQLKRFVDQHPPTNQASVKDNQAAWADLAHALMNMKAFYFLR